MSLYENKANSNLPDIEKVGFALGKNISSIILIYTFVTLIYNFYSISGYGFFGSSKEIIGNFLGLIIIILVVFSLLKPRPIYLALISIIYLVGVISILLAPIDSKGMIEYESMIFWGDSFRFFSLIYEIIFVENLLNHLSNQVINYLHFLPASLIFFALYLKSFKINSN